MRSTVPVGGGRSPLAFGGTYALTKRMNFGAEKVDLRDIRFTPELLRCIPAATARMYSVLPVFTRCDSLGVVMLDFSNLEAIDELVFITGKELQILTADPVQIRAFIELYYAEDGK